MENEPKFTKAPWAWQKFGNDYCLTGQYGMRPIVVSVGGKPRGLQLLDGKTGLLIPFTPLHLFLDELLGELARRIEFWSGGN